LTHLHQIRKSFFFHRRRKTSPFVMIATAPDACDVERYGDGTVLVRVHSCDRSGRTLPDAVFTFRFGDPQYGYWAARSIPADQRSGKVTV
jgi:hypothetical protein